MRVAILTFDGFNEIDSLVAFHLLGRASRMAAERWDVGIASPTPRVTSMNGLAIDAHGDLADAVRADAVLFGSGTKTREVAEDPAVMHTLAELDPSRQLVAAQCSGTLLLAKLGLLGDVPACTDLVTKPWVEAAGCAVSNAPFAARGNVATAGGCLSAPYVSAWLIARLAGAGVAREVLSYVAPVGEKDEYVARAMGHVEPALPR